MQDKRIHFNEKFINHAWDDMRKQLDVEMPVRQERRRWLGWWWMAGLLLLTVGVGIAAFSKKTSNTAAKPVKPIAVGATPAPNNPSGLTPSTTLPIQPATQKQPMADVPLKSKKGNADVQKGPHLLNKNGVKRGDSAAVNQAVTSIGTPLIASQEMVATPLTTFPEVINEGQGIARTALENLYLLEVADLQNLTYSSVIPSVASQQLSFNKWRLGIEGNFMRALDRPATGASAHLVASKPLKLNNLSLQVGLGYTFVQQPLGVEIVGNSFAGSGNSDEILVYYGNDFDNSGRNGLADVEASVRTSYKQGLNLSYLTVPVKLAYSFGKRFTVKMGMEGGLLMASKSDFTNSGLLKNFSQTQDESLPQSNNKNNSGAIKLASLDFAAIGGIDFKLSPRFSVGTQYKLGLKDIMPLNRTKEYNRLLQVGVTYHLAKRK